MSYSFNLRASSKAAALPLIAQEFDKVTAQQPIHELDRAEAELAAKSFLELVGEPPEGQELWINVSGSVGRIAREGAEVVTNVGVSVGVGFAQKM